MCLVVSEIGRYRSSSPCSSVFVATEATRAAANAPTTAFALPDPGAGRPAANVLRVSARLADPSTDADPAGNSTGISVETNDSRRQISRLQLLAEHRPTSNDRLKIPPPPRARGPATPARRRRRSPSPPRAPHRAPDRKS